MSDDENPIVIVLDSIVNSENGTSFRWDKPITSVAIDSTVPFIYLPDELADYIAGHFDCEYNSTFGGFYLPKASTATSQALCERSLSLTLVDHNPASNSNITIVLPYEALAMNASWTWGFEHEQPILVVQRMFGQNAVLERAFLQEVYLSILHEDGRTHFDISQAYRSPVPEQRIRPLYNSTTHERLAGNIGRRELSDGAKAI
jgi:hypothetical protein